MRRGEGGGGGGGGGIIDAYIVTIHVHLNVHSRNEIGATSKTGQINTRHARLRS